MPWFGWQTLALSGLLGGAVFATRPPSPPPDVAWIAPAAAPAGLAEVPRRVLGRDPGTGAHVWPTAGFDAQVGPGVAVVTFDDPAERWRVTVDGRPALAADRPGARALRLELPEGERHRIRVEKISESAAPGRLPALHATAPQPAPAAPARVIEVIGDSDSVGYGSRSWMRRCLHEATARMTDTSAAFPHLVASAFGAEARVIARSGIGLIRNGDGSTTPGETMHDAYLRDAAGAGPADAPPADAIVIALGANDFFEAPVAGPDAAKFAEDFVAELVAFAQARHADAPQAAIVLLAFGDYGPPIVDVHRAARDALRQGGLPAELVELGALERTACDWHPSLRDHAAIAQALAPAIAAATGWTEPPNGQVGRPPSGE